MLQASVLALAGGFLLRNVPAGASTSWWPYIVFGWAFAAAVTPWLIGGYIGYEFHPVYSLMMGVISALPFWAASRWLADSPYTGITLGCRIVVALWGLHLLLSLVAWLKSKLRRTSP